MPEPATPARDSEVTRTTPTAWLMAGICVAAYAVAVMQRTSLGVAGLQAAQHFGTTVGIVSVFVVVQLATYAAAQIPVGLLLDRFGSRAVMTGGLVIMGAGQLGLASTDTLGWAIAARILVGAGDACIFTSMARLLPFWFAPRQVPFLMQLTGLLGQSGQIASVWILLPSAIHRGWQPTFALAAGTCAVMAVVVLLAVRDVPRGQDRVQAPSGLRRLPSEVATVVGHPAVRLGFWIHLTSGFAANVFVMMWGIPFLRIGQGLGDAAASGLFVLSAVLGGVFGPAIGWLTGRHPLRRSTLALVVIWANFGCWAAVLAWPGTAPMWLLVALVAVTAAGGPGTGVGLDLARTELPRRRLGTATGFIITGSFTAGTIAILLIGVSLDLMSGGQPYTATQMRLAMGLLLPIFAVGLIGIFTSRRRLRALMVSQGVVVPSWREVAQRYRRPRR